MHSYEDRIRTVQLYQDRLPSRRRLAVAGRQPYAEIIIRADHDLVGSFDALIAVRRAQELY
jgi:hypothetical protein